MVLTYQEAVDAGARATSRHWRDMHTNEALGYQKMLTAAVLEAVGYADMLAEVERLRADKWTAVDAHCRDCCCAQSWEALGVFKYDGASIPEHITDLRAQRDALAATLARVEALSVDSRDHGGYGGVRLSAHVRIADLRAALHPKGTDPANSPSGQDLEQPGSNDASLQWVLDCRRGEGDD